jgi:hypothetical protein
MGNIFKAGGGRVWTIAYRAGPTHEPMYHQMGTVGTISWGQGDVTKIEIPSDISYNQWEEVDSYQSSPDRATTTIQVYEDTNRSEVYELVRRRCPFDVQIHKGMCEDPRDFDGGWQKVKVFEDARPTSYDTNEQSALQGEGQSSIMEDLPVSARSVYDILRMTYKEVAKNEVGEEVVSVSVCDTIACGDCDGVVSSDGCQRVIALTNSAGSSPGLLPQLIVTTDQFGTNAIIERWITTFVIGEEASDGECVGSDYVALSSDGEAIHYAPTADIVSENETWTKVTTGIVAAHGPVALWNYSPLLSFICGLGGYIYQLKSPADGLTVLDAASVVTDDLNDIAGFGTDNVATVGDAGAFVYTTDGSNFNAGIAPVGPTDLYAVAYRTQREIWVGGDDGNVYVTDDYGNTWTTKGLKGSISQIDKIIWENETVGWIAARSAGPVAKILRTINGGYSWYVVPEAAGLSIPTADYFNDLAVCEKEPNKIFAGGLADNGADGILVKGSD